MINRLVEVLQRIDPRQVDEHLPTREQKERFEAAKAICMSALQMAESGLCSVAMLLEIERGVDELAALYSELAAGTEIGGKSRLNEAVYLAQSAQVERSLYLAGIAREQKLKEPYRTQVRALASHACMARYRECYRIDEWAKENVETYAASPIAMLLDQMKRALLYQLNYFATATYTDAPDHPQAAYHKMIANLFMAYESEAGGDQPLSTNYVQSAERIANAMPEPRDDSHYMFLQYYDMMGREFSNLRRTSQKHVNIRVRIEQLASRSNEIKQNGGGVRPSEWFALSPYVSTGVRAVSVVGVVTGIAAVAGLTPNDILEGTSRAWDVIAGHVPHAGATDAGVHVASHLNNVLAMSTGGGARGMESLIDGIRNMSTGGAA